jgi:hypothetical protein
MQLLWALLCGGADPLAAPLVPSAAPQLPRRSVPARLPACLPACLASTVIDCVPQSHTTSQHPPTQRCPSTSALPLPIACSLPRPCAAAPGGQPHPVAVRAGAPAVRGRDAAGGARSRSRFFRRLLSQRPSHHLALAHSLHLVTF